MGGSWIELRASICLPRMCSTSIVKLLFFYRLLTTTKHSANVVVKFRTGKNKTWLSAWFSSSMSTHKLPYPTPIIRVDSLDQPAPSEVKWFARRAEQISGFFLVGGSRPGKNSPEKGFFGPGFSLFVDVSSNPCQQNIMESKGNSKKKTIVRPPKYVNDMGPAYGKKGITLSMEKFLIGMMMILHFPPNDVIPSVCHSPQEIWPY